MPTAGVDVDPSTRPLSEVARHLVVPSGVVDTLWFEVEEQCHEWGDEFDIWQDGLGQYILGLRDDGMFAASIGGVTLSIPRQVAKTFLVGRIVFALCAGFPNTTVIWTAHRTRTATQTFEKLKAFAKRPAVKAHLAKGRNNGLRDSHGEQEIRFANGSVIMFGAREQGFGRGFDEVDVIVFDEAQILTEKALEDMVAATNQSRFPHGALLFYMGTPPRPVDPGEVFTLRRQKALAVAEAREAGDAVLWDALYVECSADPEKARADPNDKARWAEANPSFPHRTPLLSMLRLRENLPSNDSWLREALGVWDDDNRSGAIPNWADLRYVEGESVGIASNATWALAVSPIELGPQWASFGKAGLTAGGFLHIECIDRRKGTRWIVPFAKEQVALNGGLPLRVHRGAPEGAFIDDLKAAGVLVEEVGGVDEAHATGQLVAAAGTEDTAPTLRHLGDPFLDKAVANAELKSGPDGAAKWDQKKTTIEITPLRAVTIALGGVPQEKPVDLLANVH